jgi:hypothetical protein
MDNSDNNIYTSPRSRSPDAPSTAERHPLKLTDLFLVAYLEMQGHKIEPLISTDGPFDHMISFDIIGDLPDIKRDIDDYHHHVLLSRFLKSYKSVRNQMWTMKAISKQRDS